MSKKQLLFVITVILIGAGLLDTIQDDGRAWVLYGVAILLVALLTYRYLDERPTPTPKTLMPVPNHFEVTHFKAITVGGRKFVYCPVGNICSWSPSDYDHEWCHYCSKFFNEIGA